VFIPWLVLEAIVLDATVVSGTAGLGAGVETESVAEIVLPVLVLVATLVVS
jgi:hypothetical protein